MCFALQAPSSKKLNGISGSAVPEISISTTSRLLIKDITTNRSFLIDSGADLSVIPPSTKHKQSGESYPIKLFAVNGTEIRTYGTQLLHLDFGLRRTFPWIFLIADVTSSLVGADFLKHHHLLPDLKNRVLVDGKTLITTPATLSTAPSLSISFIQKDDSVYKKILQQYPEIVSVNSSLKCNKKTNAFHFIETTGRPVNAKARRLDPKRLKIAKREFQFMLDQGIIQPSKSEWANPLHMVPKSNGDWRPCGDYRFLNKITTPDKYSIPFITDFTYNLKDCQVFSKLDLVRAYHQIRVNPADVPKTAIITPFGLFEFLKMPFGLRNAAQTFQRFMDEVCRGLEFVFVYIDDVLIASKNEDEHIKHLNILFDRFKQHGILINPGKCTFGAKSIDFLGFNITSDGLKPSNAKVDAIIKYPKPNTVAELRRFLAMINFYRKFMPEVAKHQVKLNDLLKGATKNDKTPIPWTADLEDDFHLCKEDLANSVVLSHPNPDAEICLKVDASDFAIGAAIEQFDNGNWRPLGFFSRKLSKAETKYSTYDRELLAAYCAIKHFRHILEGRKFVLYTDHKPLIFAFSQNPEKATPRQYRHLDFISQFTTDIRHISGKFNTVADAMSRIEEISCINYEEIAKTQQTDEEFANFRNSPTGLEFKLIQIPNSNVKLYCDVSTEHARPYVPLKFRKIIFNNIHGLSHPGTRSTRRLLTQRFVWPSINKDCNEWVKTCQICQAAKVNRHTKSKFGTFPAETQRFATIHMDIVGPLPPSEGFQYLLTIIDRFTRWIEVIPLKGITAEEVCRSFFEGWVSRFGCPQKIHTDRGRQFISKVFNNIAKTIGAQHQQSTAYHPQANGIVERLHRTLKTALISHENQQWTKTLPMVLLGLRTVYKEDIQSSPAELVYGEVLRLPGDFFKSNIDPNTPASEILTLLRQSFDNVKSVPASNHSNQKPFVHKDLMNTSHVWIKLQSVKPLCPKYAGPYKVLNRKEKFFTVQIKSKAENISIDRLKPAFLENEVAELIINRKDSTSLKMVSFKPD